MNVHDEWEGTAYSITKQYQKDEITKYAKVATPDATGRAEMEGGRWRFRFMG